MTIAIDGYEANVPNRVGIGRYAFEVLQGIYLLFTKNQELRTKNVLRIYLPNKTLPDMPPEKPWWEYRIVHPKTLWTFFALPMALMTDKPSADVMFSPTHYIPRYVRTPRAMSIMDTSYLEYPEMFRKKDLYQLTSWTRYSAIAAKKILTISQYSKNAIIKAYGIPDSKVVVTYPGLSMSTVKTPASPAGRQKSKVLEQHGIQKPYILSVGTIQPRKNYTRLIEAFSRLEQKEMQLIIVGKKGWLFEESLEAPKRFNVSERVRFLDFVEDRDLHVLYEEALCMALPSIYEGFGLPVLEAMAHSCPVVISHVSSLPEIGGEAAIYVDPESVESITKGLMQAVSEHSTPKESKRIKMGLMHSKKFSWEKAASQTLEVLTKVGDGHI